MNLEALKNKTILLLGKSRAFCSNEFTIQLSYLQITLALEYAPDVVLIVEGKMMTPYEQNYRDTLYEERKAPFISIDDFEKELACGIDEETLLMSLKLSHDASRLKSFLQNPMISDTLFLKLLKMYSWGGEDFFENDDNRDVSAAIIVRFYENIERNHNVQYATLGLMHLVSQCKNIAVLESIVGLEPLQKSFQSDARDLNYTLITAIATHYLTPQWVLKMFIQKSNSYVKTLIAMRSDCNGVMQKLLYEDGDESVKEALSYNTHLDKAITIVFIEGGIYAKNIAKHIQLDDALFAMLVEKYPKELAQNESLTFTMQIELLEVNDEETKIALASNLHIDENVVAKLVRKGSQDINFAIYANAKTPSRSLIEAYENKMNHVALSYNQNTPEALLRILAQSENPKILEGLAKNPSTPVDILYQLQLHSQLERFVKENPTFGKHIMSESIGWEV